MRIGWVLYVVLLLCLDTWAGYWWWSWRREHRFAPYLQAAALAYQVDPALIKAVIWQESRFHPQACGPKGELGLMQIRELAAQEWAAAKNIPGFRHEQILEPAWNIDAGTWYLAKLLGRYSNTDRPEIFALADYNAGRTHVRRWMQNSAATNSAVFLERITYPGTRKYIIKVVERQRYYNDE